MFAPELESAANLTPEIDERLEELNQAFFAYPDSLTAVLYRYVSKHRNEIAVPESF